MRECLLKGSRPLNCQFGNWFRLTVCRLKQVWKWFASTRRLTVFVFTEIAMGKEKSRGRIEIIQKADAWFSVKNPNLSCCRRFFSLSRSVRFSDLNERKSERGSPKKFQGGTNGKKKTSKCTSSIQLWPFRSTGRHQSGDNAATSSILPSNCSSLCLLNSRSNRYLRWAI
jgi:hypothetical protein